MMKSTKILSLVLVGIWALLFIACEEKSPQVHLADVTLPPLITGDMKITDLGMNDQSMISDQAALNTDQRMTDQVDQEISDQSDQRMTDHMDQFMSVDALIINQAEWQKRSCQFALQTFSPGYQSVQLAGEFTDWASRPISATAIGNGKFEVIFDENAGLLPGQMYAYKWIKDGQWQIDDVSPLRKYDGNCVNSAFIYPDCGQPEIIKNRLEINQNRLMAEFKILAPAQHEISAIRVTMDQIPVPVTLQPEISSLRIDKSGISIGKHWLAIEVEAENGKSASIKMPFWVEDEAFLWQDQVLYLLLIDRFADGDSSNNQPLHGVVYPEVDWHGGDLIGATAVLNAGYFDRLGVKAIWLSPVNAQTNGDFGDRAVESRRIAAYHGYWPIKARMVEPRFGSDQALRDFVQAAHAKGIRVLLDLINNQVHEQHEYYQNHPDWFRTNCICGTNGCGWSEKPLECLFASYLPDINWRNAEAEKQFIADALSWVEDFDVDGFRVDAVKHVESSAIFNLRYALDQKFGGGERIVMIGETAVGQNDQWQDGCGESFQNGYAWINGYIGQNALDGQFDFPTHHQIRWQLLSGDGQYPNVENALQMASSQYDDQSLMVQFIGSHDTSRVVSEAENQPNFGCAWPSECTAVGLVENVEVIKRLWRAWIVLYTQTAMPLLYYGDEIAMPGSTDPDNRRDMVFDGALANLTPAFDQRFPTQLNDLQLKQRAFLETLGQIRQHYREMIKKSHYQRWLIDSDVWVYGFEMGQQRLIIALNQGQQHRNLQFAFSTPANRAQDLFSSFAMANDRSLIGQSNLQLQNQQVSLDLSDGGMGIWLVE